MTYLRSMRDREVWGPWDNTSVNPRLSLYRLFEKFTCYKEDEHAMTPAEEGGTIPLPFSCAFSQHSSSTHIVAVANEDGKVHLIDTQRSAGPLVKTWQAHVNAVFDIAWVCQESKLVTGSGDQTAQLWDVESTKCISVFKGHTCSLRSISFKPNHPNVFATGARDGNIMVWDTRTRPMKSGYYKPVNVLHGVHNTAPPVPSSSRRSNRQAANTESQQSVTTVLFKDENSLYSSGAADGAIKMWDMRRYYTTAKGAPQPRHTYPYVGTATHKNGISCLSLTRSGSHLLSSCTDDNIYMYNTLLDSKDPVSVFSGHTNSTFYVKTSVTCDDRFLVSGSSCNSMFVWDLGKPELAPVKLHGHSGEVTSVACSGMDLGLVVSCSDDNTVRLWRLQDQISLCKEGHKVGSADRVKEHVSVEMTSLNLHSREPSSPSTPSTSTTPRSGGRDKRSRTSSGVTPSRKRQGSTPTRPHSTPKRPDRAGRLLTIIEDDQVPGSSGRPADPPTPRKGSTPVSSPVRQSPRLEQRTPGKISAYFRSNGMMSSEKKQISESPLRHSPKMAQSSPGRTIRMSSLSSPGSSSRPPPASPGPRPASTPSPKKKLRLNEPLPNNPLQPGSPSSPDHPVRRSPRKQPRSSNTLPSKLPNTTLPSNLPSNTPTEPANRTPESGRAKDTHASNKLSGSSVHASVTTPTKPMVEPRPTLLMASPGKRRKVPITVIKPVPPASPGLTLVSVGTQSPGVASKDAGIQSPGAADKVSMGTQTSPPPACTSSCRGCCREYAPPSGPTPAKPANTTPSTIRPDLTPKSCSNSSSIPRPKRIHHDVPTTPTKGLTRIVKGRTPEKCAVSERRRKFTRTGTPIHHNNCRCKFCVSSATDISEMSSSPILEMPCRPRKRLVSGEPGADIENSPKRRKSLFVAGEMSQEPSMQSCSPYSQEAKENQAGNSQSPKVTVRAWLGAGKLGAGSRGTRQGDKSEVGTSKVRRRSGESEETGEGKEEDEVEETHDHSQCRDLHCIRSFFAPKS